MKTQSAVTLKFNGKPLDLDPPLPVCLVIQATIDKWPHDEVFDMKQATARIGCGDSSMRAFVADRRFQRYYMKSGSRGDYRFGHPKAIVLLGELIREHQAERAK